MSDLENKTKTLSLLGQRLTEAGKAKTPVDRAKALASANRLVADLKWDEFRDQLSRELKSAGEELDNLLTRRRDDLHQAARERKFYRQHGDSDSIDIFKVRFRDARVIIEFAGAEVEQLEEYDGAKLLDHLSALKKRLEKSAYDREGFFRQLDSAIRAASLRENPRDGYVPILPVWREMVLEHAWAKSSFAKSGLAKDFPDYPLCQFLFDLARFFEGGSKVGGKKLSSRSPAMSESRKAFAIPRLSHPDADPQYTHFLKIE